MTIELAQRLQRIRPSATVSITARAQRLRAQGRDVIVLSVGEPDFPTPEHVKAAATAALARDDTKYTPVDGSGALKEAIVARKTSYEIRRLSIETSGLVTLAEDGIHKAAQGLTTVAEVLRGLPRVMLNVDFENPTGDRRSTDFLNLTALRAGAVPTTAQIGVRMQF